MTSNRRQFIHSLAGVTALSVLNQSTTTDSQTNKFPISCNSYNWITFYGRENKNWGEDLDACMAEFAKTGIKAYEPGLDTAQQVAELIPVLKKYNLSMPSVYVGSVMHKQDEVEKELIGGDVTEFPSKKIGELVAKRLKKKDKIAYIRFSSVFRQFVDIEDLEKEVHKLI